MKKIIGIFLKLFIIIFILVVLYFVVSGFIMYSMSLSEFGFEEKIDSIIQSENYVKLEEIPQYYWQAVVAIEDKRFFEHGAIDIKSILRAFVINLKEQNFTEGGSSITQQLVKNLYFSQEKKIERKVAEVFMAYKFENVLTKYQILEMYINSIYYGDGYYGIYEASMGYFGKHPSKLDLYEATLLCGVPNAPSIYALSNNNEYTYERQKEVVTCMYEQGYITKEEVNYIYSLEREE